ncbi:hypothetical protein MTO96_031354 [Rhipicephalus appendiculatus]
MPNPRSANQFRPAAGAPGIAGQQSAQPFPRRRRVIAKTPRPGGNSEDHFAFPFQYPKRPMCHDVFYTICQRSPQREFHYRRSMNACVETAADVVHSCNRGDNRFASLVHCRQKCMGVYRRPASECFGKPLFTNCARTIACERQHRKYPFFADLSPRDGRMRCLPSSPDVLRDRRCLTGANRFRTLEACEVTCQKTSRA